MGMRYKAPDNEPKYILDITIKCIYTWHEYFVFAPYEMFNDNFRVVLTLQSLESHKFRASANFILEFDDYDGMLEFQCEGVYGHIKQWTKTIGDMIKEERGDDIQAWYLNKETYQNVRRTL